MSGGAPSEELVLHLIEDLLARLDAAMRIDRLRHEHVRVAHGQARRLYALLRRGFDHE
ncbi:MAG TPA: hypothetical protein VMR74_12710 [Gammaproteobacteria bacterium]|nr:hypothetical protein [Gammaproteobacteria bacterium]